MTKQDALDELETAVLDDIFGGHTVEAMSVRVGLLNINLAGKAQKLINEMEDFLSPILDDDGFVSVQKNDKKRDRNSRFYQCAAG